MSLEGGALDSVPHAPVGALGSQCHYGPDSGQHRDVRVPCRYRAFAGSGRRVLPLLCGTVARRSIAVIAGHSAHRAKRARACCAWLVSTRVYFGDRMCTSRTYGSAGRQGLTASNSTLALKLFLVEHNSQHKLSESTKKAAIEERN